MIKTRAKICHYFTGKPIDFSTFFTGFVSVVSFVTKAKYGVPVTTIPAELGSQSCYTVSPEELLEAMEQARDRGSRCLHYLYLPGENEFVLVALDS